MKSLKKILLLCLFTASFVFINGQDTFIDYRITKDTLVAGETNVFLINSGEYQDTANIHAYFVLKDYISFDECPEDLQDTLNVTKFEIVDDTILRAFLPIPLSAYPTEYTLNYEEWGTANYWQMGNIYLISKPYIVEEMTAQIACANEDVTLDIWAYHVFGNTYKWYDKKDQLVAESYSPQLVLENISAVDTGLYYCIVENNYGSVTSKKALVSIYPSVASIGLPSGETQKCLGAEDLVYSLPAEELIDSYDWVLSPENAGTLDMNDNSVTVHWDAAFMGAAEIYAKTQIGQCPGPDSDILNVQVIGPEIVPEICIVRSDEESGKYSIVWNKIADNSIDEYNIYRESNQAGVFLKLESVPEADFSVYVDQSSSPDVYSHSYCLSYTDTCGNESVLSQIHSTMHLTVSAGMNGESNLTWNDYLGFPYLSYDIFRGTHPDTLVFLEKISSGLNSYTDFNPPIGSVYYQLAITRDGACAPSKKSLVDYSTTKSNIVLFGDNGFAVNLGNDLLDIYPNPAKENVNIIFSEQPSSDTKILVFNISGQLIKSIPVCRSKVEMKTGDLTNGVYILKAEVNGQPYVKRLMIKK